MGSLVDGSASAAEFMRRFSARTQERRVPFVGMLELTSRCNLRCVHCYLGPQEEQHRKRAAELTTAEVFRLLDEMAEAGTLNLTITGGDPMMRPDFADIYRHARTRGLLVSVFCDGILVTDRIVELFRELPPSTVEVSIYGATAETYERITRVPGSYVKFVAGVRRLLDGGIRTAFKTVLMTLNRHELPEMQRMAREWGGSFRFDSAIFPCLPDSRSEPIDLRVEPEEAAAAQLSDPEVLKEYADYFERWDDLAPSKELYQCGAGVTAFYVGPFGEVSPCLMTTRYRYDARKEGGFAARWRDDVGALRSRRAEHPDHGCSSCSVRAVCDGCPAMFALETGREDVKSDYVCRTTQARVQILRDEIERRNGRTYLRVLGG